MKTIDGKILTICFKKGTEVLLSHVDEINALNVFPVPDGDTGSNMSSSMLEACKHLDSLESKGDLQKVLQAIEMGTLMGARGNSGVILSQIFRGFSQSIKDRKNLKPEDFALALKSSREVAYSAVMKPVEGTLLTIVRVLAEEVDGMVTEDFKEFMQKLWQRSMEVVEETPKYLKKLRDAGVVDSGAKGFAYIIEGFYRALNGDTDVNLAIESAGPMDIVRIAQEELKYLYCTEAVVRLTQEVNVEDLRKYYNDLGDSLILVSSGDVLKFHVHTNTPGMAIDKALEYGELMKTKIDNMKIQHHQIMNEEPKAKKEKKEYGIVVVADGSGLEAIFKSLGVDVIVGGGQSSNPSTAQIKEAVEGINADTVFVFPNNSNILLAANSVKEMVENKKVVVIKTSTVQQGLAALFAFNSQAPLLENEKRIKEAIDFIGSIEITQAVRDSRVQNVDVKKDQYIGFLNGNLICSANTLDEAVVNALAGAKTGDAEIVTIFYGKDVPEEDAEVMVKEVQIHYPSVDVELYYGGQPHYHYLISVE